MELDEQKLLPFHATPLDGESILVLAPHPDDEVIGCGGMLAINAAEGRHVRVVVVTDGAGAASSNANVENYRARRRDESRRGLELLGIEDLHFLDLPDRKLATLIPQIVGSIGSHVAELRPDLIVAPAPLDIHPDHRSVVRAVWELCQDREQARALRDVRIALYETSQAISPNVLVDITAVADTKFAAIRAHESQMEIRDYEWFSRGLAQYRALTLPPEVRYAEGYHVTTVGELSRIPWSELTQSVRPSIPSGIEISSEPLPITVVVRTKNRPRLLREALESVAASDYPARGVVVNDGGEDVREIVASIPIEIELVHHEESRGRSAAANSGVERASTRFVTFLDDDDLYYPEHLATLAAHHSSEHAAVYTDAVSAFFRKTDGGWELRDTMRIFTSDYDPQLLLLDNYIPLPTLLIERQTFLDTGGFDRRLDLFEDWEFLIRLSQRGPFLHVPRVTCEVRHFEGGDSAILSSPEGSAAYREAKIEVWNLHRQKLTDALLLDVHERQKRRILDLDDRLMNETGRARQMEGDVRRLEREKRALLDQMGEEHERAAATVHQLGGRLQQVQSELAEARESSRSLERLLTAHEGTISQRDESLRTHYEEIRRLNDILDTIYGSRTWKLHLIAEKLRGR
jgi:LmbE family N-acetylglucosaminyl deacetylase/glycosyltransferase involved in cell wall biosynthesis